ncbi:glycosyltransferase family 4 protein [Candidatus Collierbacteria bacterium]|nr:glycosyltransferase family 4 protein [Candidatus Collierbacteria bacterium]
MNILFLTPRNSKKHLGGVEGHVRLLTEELERRGHEVRELSLSDIEVKENKDKRRLGKVEEKTNKIKAWIYLWKKRDLFRWAEVVHIHDVFWWLLPFWFLNRLGLLDGSFNSLNKVAKRDTNDTNRHANDANKGKIYTTFHGWEGVCPPTRSAIWQKKLAQKLSRGTIGVGRFFKKWYGVEQNRAVWGVVDPRISKLCKCPTLPRQGRAFAFFGRLEKVNGAEVVVEAIRKIIDHIKARPFPERPGLFRYFFVGDGSYRREAEKFGKVTGMVKDPEKYLVDADVVITSSYMSMLEATARGKSVIAVANNELKKDYLDGHPLRKYIKVVKNADELIRVIKGLYKGPALDSQGRALKDLRSAYLWALKQTPEKLADAYESLWKIPIN